MARIADKPQLDELAGTEILLATSVDGGTDTEAEAVLPGADVHIPGTQLRDWLFGGTIALSAALNEAKATDIASAATTDIGAATGNLVHITGTTTITALGTVQAGTRRKAVFDGILILTHHATSLILPTGANITTAAGDTAEFISEGSGNWRCTGYQRATGQPLAAASGSVTSVNGASGAPIIRQALAIACSDETTALTTGTNKVKFINPYSTAFNVLAVVASLSNPQTSGSILTIDINEAGVSILSTKLTIDNGETNSSSAATAAVISDASIAAYAEIGIDIDQIGDGTAKGLKVYLIGYPTP
ncbi:MAG TPA: hypothetical protein VLC71_05850 [Thermomonas sp.]|nr:hypothetical protein [Thermomonas sp.]